MLRILPFLALLTSTSAQAASGSHEACIQRLTSAYAAVRLMTGDSKSDLSDLLFPEVRAGRLAIEKKQQVDQAQEQVLNQMFQYIDTLAETCEAIR